MDNITSSTKRIALKDIVPFGHRGERHGACSLHQECKGFISWASAEPYSGKLPASETFSMACLYCGCAPIKHKSERKVTPCGCRLCVCKGFDAREENSKQCRCGHHLPNHFVDSIFSKRHNHCPQCPDDDPCTEFSGEGPVCSYCDHTH